MQRLLRSLSFLRVAVLTAPLLACAQDNAPGIWEVQSKPAAGPVAMERQIEILSWQVKTSRSETDRARRDAAALAASLQEALDENESLRTALRAKDGDDPAERAAATDIEELKGEVAGLRDAVKAGEARAADLRARLEVSQAKRKAQTDEVVALLAALNASRDEADKLRREITDLRNDAGARADALLDLQVEHAELREDLLAAEADLAARAAQIDRQAGLLRARQADISGSRDEIAALTTKVARLADAVAAGEATNGELSAALSTANARLSAKSAEADRLKSDIAELRTRQQDSADKARRLALETGSLTAALNARDADFVSINDEMATLSQELAAAAGAKVQVEDRVGMMGAEIERLRAALAAREAALDARDDQLVLLNDEVATLSREIARMSLEIERLRAHGRTSAVTGRADG